MYENEQPSEEREESMNDILTSIRELVYPRRQDAFEKEESTRAQTASSVSNVASSAENKVVIDLMRPVQEPVSELAAREQLLKEAVLRESAAREQVQKTSDIPVIEEELSKEIFRAFSSFEQAISHPKAQNAVHPSSEKPTHAAEDNNPDKASDMPSSSNQFLEKLVKEALITSLHQKIEDLASPMIQNAVQTFLPEILETWIAKNLSNLVIACVEKKLDEMKEKAADRRF
jgi:hypothetical protein